MNADKKQITDFLDKCEELKKCKFIMATTKIKDLLKCIVNSAKLYGLFDSVTQDFDYIAAKQQCFKRVDNGIENLSYISLPEKVGDRLAFIFCLLVEFDRDTLNFNDFLRQYFPQDGSYFASYHAFCDCVIVSLEQLVAQVFEDILSAPDNDTQTQIKSAPNADKARLLSGISLLIAREKQFITSGSLSQDEKESGLKILTDLEKAAISSDLKLIDALVCAYNYYVLYNNCVSDGVEGLITSLAELECV